MDRQEQCQGEAGLMQGARQHGMNTIVALVALIALVGLVGSVRLAASVGLVGLGERAGGLVTQKKWHTHTQPCKQCARSSAPLSYSVASSGPADAPS